MSEWKVFCETIEIFSHPNAEKLQLGRIGSFQVVVGKDLYTSQDVVVFAPKRSILPADLRPYFTNEETGKSYLRGPNEDRVGSIRLRGEESEGVILPFEWWCDKIKSLPKSYKAGDDISSYLGITENIPGVAGTPGKKNWNSQGDIIDKVENVVEMDRFTRHDVEQYGIFKNEFVPGELVSVTEKIHGSQISIMKDKYGKIAVTSKGRAEKNFVLREFPVAIPFHGRSILNKIKNTFRWLTGWKGEMNEYWKVAYDSGILDFINDEQFSGHEIQIIGEVVPFQSGFSYGCNLRQVLVFRAILDTVDQEYGIYDADIAYVPQLYFGPYDPEKILPLANGMETVSGKSLHIREGIVITPRVFRRTKGGVPLLVKAINKKYKSNDEDIV